MLLNVLKGKIHRATVTQAELDYIGSITIDSELMEAAGIQEYWLPSPIATMAIVLKPMLSPASLAVA